MVRFGHGWLFGVKCFVQLHYPRRVDPKSDWTARRPTDGLQSRVPLNISRAPRRREWRRAETHHFTNTPGQPFLPARPASSRH